MKRRFSEQIIRINSAATLVPLGILLGKAAIDSAKAILPGDKVDVVIVVLISGICFFLLLAAVGLEYMIVSKKSVVASIVACVGLAVTFVIFTIIYLMEFLENASTVASRKGEDLTWGLAIVLYIMLLILGHAVGFIRNKQLKSSRGFPV